MSILIIACRDSLGFLHSFICNHKYASAYFRCHRGKIQIAYASATTIWLHSRIWSYLSLNVCFARIFMRLGLPDCDHNYLTLLRSYRENNYNWTNLNSTQITSFNDYPINFLMNTSKFLALEFMNNVDNDLSWDSRSSVWIKLFIFHGKFNSY